MRKPIPGTLREIDGDLLKVGLIGLWSAGHGGNLAFDLSGNNHHGTFAGHTHVTGSRFGGAWRFDGADDYIDLGNPAILDFTSGPFTIAAWIKTVTGAAGQAIAMKFASAYSQFWFMLNNAGTITAGLYDGVTWQEAKQDDQDWGDNMWHHTAFVVTTAELFAYADGVVGGTTGVHDNSFPTNSANWWIGCRNDLLLDMAGDIDGVTFHNRALSANELVRLYQEPGWWYKARDALRILAA